MDDLGKLRAAFAGGGLRAVLRGARRRLLLRAVELAKRPLHPRVSAEPSHQVFERFVREVNALGRPRVLEIGARARSGTTQRGRFPGADYVGLDVVAGENVDVVGDAHAQGQLWPGDGFDAVFGVSVFEHLAMPWKAVLEMNRVLRPGGLACVFTHPAYPPHDRPWDFWRYAPEAFEVLFARATGFELVACAEGLRAAIVPLADEPALTGLWREPVWLAVCALARKIGPPDPRLRWDVPLEEVLTSRYPA